VVLASRVDEYCEWVMDAESNIAQRKSARGYDKTVCIAHNSRGFDSRFVLKYLDSKSLIPETVRANGASSIQYIYIYQLQMVDLFGLIASTYSMNLCQNSLKLMVLKQCKGPFSAWV